MKIRLVILLALLFPVIALFGQAPALAQGALQCETYSLFPGTDWTVDLGVAGSDQVVRNVINPTPTSHYEIAVHKSFSTPKVIYKVIANVYFNNPNLAEAATFSSTLTLGGNPAGGQSTFVPAATVWHQWTQTYYPAGNKADRIDIDLQNPDPDLALQMFQLCFLDIPPTNTPTNTPAPTSVPTDTPVPTETNTPDWTDTPVPTLTETSTGTLPPTSTITRTPLPTRTPAPTRTPIPATLGSGSFSSPVPPQSCQDPFNPCGALPFDVPNFPPINLPSPPPFTAVAMVDPTLLPNLSMTPFGTGTVTATGTFVTEQAGVYDYATNIAQVANDIQITPGLLDDNSQLIDIANSGNQIGSYIGGFFAVARAVQGFFLGKTGNVIALFLLLVAFIIIVNILCFVLPILVKIASFILNIIKVIPFIG